MWTSDSLRVIESADEGAVAAILDRSAARNADVERAAAEIVVDVRRRGDAAVREYASRFDGLDGAFEIPRSEMKRAAQTVPAGVRRAIREAARNIRHVASRQVP